MSSPVLACWIGTFWSRDCLGRWLLWLPSISTRLGRLKFQVWFLMNVNDLHTTVKQNKHMKNISQVIISAPLCFSIIVSLVLPPYLLWFTCFMYILLGRGQTQVSLLYLFTFIIIIYSLRYNLYVYIKYAFIYIFIYINSFIFILCINYMLYLLSGGYIWENIASNPGCIAQSPESLILTLKLL